MTYNWPSREEWAAGAERAVRTACYPWQRVSRSPGDWLTPGELAAGRDLYQTLVKRIRSALQSQARRSDGPGLTEGITEIRRRVTASNRIATAPDADVDELHREWLAIARIAREQTTAPEEIADRLEALARQMWDARNEAAEEALAAAIRREVGRRNSDAGWARELERRARIERGPTITTIRA